MSAAPARLYSLDAPLDDEAEADRAWRSVIAGVTLAKADPARRRNQPIGERVTVTWTDE